MCLETELRLQVPKNVLITLNHLRKKKQFIYIILKYVIHIIIYSLIIIYYI